MQKTADELRAAGRRIGFVPTMGYLHAGHLSLIDLARSVCDAVVVSIFVNPAQFGPNEDLEKYPRNLEMDRENCRSRGVDFIYYPETGDMYPENYRTYISVGEITEIALR